VRSHPSLCLFCQVCSSVRASHFGRQSSPALSARPSRPERSTDALEFRHHAVSGHVAHAGSRGRTVSAPISVQISVPSPATTTHKVIPHSDLLRILGPHGRSHFAGMRTTTQYDVLIQRRELAQQEVLTGAHRVVEREENQGVAKLRSDVVVANHEPPASGGTDSGFVKGNYFLFIGREL
jgi:hypothetical protein